MARYTIANTSNSPRSLNSQQIIFTGTIIIAINVTIKQIQNVK